MTVPTVPGGDLLNTNGTVTVLVRSLPTNFNPSTPAGDNRITQMVMEQVWPQPFVTGPSFNAQTSGLLVSAEVRSVSPFTVVYVIDPHAIWSDGTPITAADFFYAWQEHLSTSSMLPDSGLVAGYRDITSVTGSSGGRTVTVTFGQPFSGWQSLFANLVPAHIAKKDGWSAAFAGFSPNRVISGGPFEVTSYIAGHELVLSRNPRYWGVPAHVAHIRFLVEPSRAALVAALASNPAAIAEIDTTRLPPGEVGPGIVSSATPDGAGPTAVGSRQPTSRLAWSSVAGSKVWQVCFNLQDPLISQLAIRRAIEHALDRSEIVADSVDLVDPRIRVAQSRLMVAGEPSNVGATRAIPQLAPVLYSPNQALSFFAMAGYRPGAGGLLRLQTTGRPLVIDLLEPSQYWAIDQAGLVIQAELRAVGVTVRLEQQPLSKMLSTSLPRGRYQLALAPFGVSPTIAAMAPQYTNSVLPPGTASGLVRTVPPVSALAPPADQPWATTTALGTEPGAAAAGAVTRDICGISDPAISQLFAQALKELNPLTALSDLQKAEARMWNQVYSIPLFQPGFVLVRSLQIDNVSESPTWAGIMWDAEDWAMLKARPNGAGATGRAHG
ncbi:MAG: ABC transporter substrate-binding protein [Acidimicrobiales bacterium]